MKPISMLGIVLAVLGALALIYQGFNYTRRERILDVGPIHATADEQHHVSFPPIAGGVVLVAGVALLLVGAKQKS